MTPQLSSMSAEDKRIAIATACGLNPYHWKFNYQHEEGWDEACGYESFEVAQNEWKTIYDGPHHADPIVRYSHTPDYLNSLDACHEMEKALSPDQKLKYQELLYLFGPRDGSFASWHWIHATAEQRSNCFLLALNLATK